MNLALKFAIQKAGGTNALAEKLGITPQAIRQWDEVPHPRVIQVEKITGVSRKDLRPDLYPPEPSAVSA